MRLCKSAAFSASGSICDANTDSGALDGIQWIEPADARSLRRHPHLEHLLDKVPVYRIKGDREIILVPYCLAGTFGGGVRTMFPTVRPD